MECSWGENLPQEFAFRSTRFITTFIITESGNLSFILRQIQAIQHVRHPLFF